MCTSFVKLSIFVYGGCVCLRAVFVCLTFKFGDELKHLQKYHRLLKHLLEINKNLNPGFSSVLLVLSLDFNEGTFCASTLIALTSKQCNSGFFKCHIKAPGSLHLSMLAMSVFLFVQSTTWFYHDHQADIQKIGPYKDPSLR